tara:strand:+ start:520 stop:699 length:180 start_codon:yes stop_codon:yes gene_type:complete
LEDGQDRYIWSNGGSSQYLTNTSQRKELSLLKRVERFEKRKERRKKTEDRRKKSEEDYE